MNSLKGLSAVAFLVIFLVPIISIAAPVPILVSKVSGGEDHTLILTESNSVWSCGWNYYYQLGDNTQTNRYIPVQVYDGEMNTASDCLENIIEISSGYLHSIAIDSNRSVLAWGSDSYGKLGNGPNEGDSNVPIRVHGGEQETQFLSYIKAIAAGRSGNHCLCVDMNGLTYAWGNDNMGQVGVNSWNDSFDMPKKVLGGQMGTPYLRNIIAVSAGTDHSMALEKIDSNDPNCKGRIYSFGNNEYGKLGIKISGGISKVPVKVHSVNVNDDSNGLQNITAISAGWYHSMALEKIDSNDPNCKGRVYCWGANNGRLGNGYTNNSSVPVIVLTGQQDPNHPTASLKNIVAISAGSDHCIALEKLDVVNDANCRGRVYTWGNNSYGQLGTSNNNTYITPVRVRAPDRDGDGQPDDLDGDANTTDYLGDDVPIVYISAGYWHSLAVDANGRVYSWGKNVDESGLIGQLGIGVEGNKNIPTPLYIYDLNVYNQRTSKCYKRIQSAINEAINNDVIVAYEGNYSEKIDCNKAITLKSVDPNNWSVVDNTRIYGSNENVITLTNNLGSSKIAGFTMIGVGSNCGIYCYNFNPTISRCRIRNFNYGISCDTSTPIISRCSIKNSGYGISGSSANLTISRCSIENNTFYGIYCQSGTATITDTFINNNSTSYEGGGNVCAESGAGITVDRCIIARNHNSAGSINVWGSTAVITNSIIHHNNGNGIYLNSVQSAKIRNNTIVDNNSYGIYKSSGTAPDINSNIIWGNSSSLYGISSKVNFNCIQGQYTGSGIRNIINQNPQFRNADNDDYHLTPDSNCIERGDPNFVADDNETDIDGENRVIDVNVDMGADEFHYCSGRVDIFPASPDGIVNFLDFVILANAWLTNAGQGDYNEVVDFADDGVIDYKDLDVFCDCWLYATGQYLDNHQQSLDGEMMMMSVSPANTLTGSAQSQEDLSASDQMMTESDDQQQDEQESMMPDYNLPAIYLTCDTNTPDPNDEVTIWVHSDAPLFGMGMGIYVIGDANITTAMSEADCNQFGWDNGWNSDPYIDLNGYVFTSGVRWDADVNGTVSYIKFRYHSGQVSVSIDQEYSIAFSWDGESCPIVPLSQEAILIGRDPNDPNEP